MNEKLKERIQALVSLGKVLMADPELEAVIERAFAYNPWFTKEFCHLAIDAIIGKMLSPDKLEQWLTNYDTAESTEKPKTIGIIMAGNLPLVGFHDFLCAYISGVNMKIKLSGKDDVLFTYVYQLLSQIDPSLPDRSAIIERLEGFDAVIATGSNNTNRYFEYYFRNYPKILRKSRSSVAILRGGESDRELFGLADDIFTYFGFGCRNVSKLYVPDGYDVRGLFPYFEKYKWMHSHTKYMNNYDYNRTLFLMNRTPHLANEFIMLQESSAIISPVAVLNYEMYENMESLRMKLHSDMGAIQCVVSDESTVSGSGFASTVRFGHSQSPELWDYADNVDTLLFIFSLKSSN